MTTISLSDRQPRRPAAAAAHATSATVTPMPFPRRRHEHEQHARATAAASSVQRAWAADMSTAERYGRDIGLAAGRRQGYIAGWYWGLVCGLVAGSLGTAGVAALCKLV